MTNNKYITNSFLMPIESETNCSLQFVELVMDKLYNIFNDDEVLNESRSGTIIIYHRREAIAFRYSKYFKGFSADHLNSLLSKDPTSDIKIANDIVLKIMKEFTLYILDPDEKELFINN